MIHFRVMRATVWLTGWTWGALWAQSPSQDPTPAPPAQLHRPPEHAMAATGHPLATQAALAAMKEGGNAVDGTLAAALTLAVVDSHNSGLGGGLFMLIHAPDGTLTALDGREMAPAAAHRDMFVRNGQAVPELSQTGALAAAVPGFVAALHEASHLARLPLSHHFENAAKLAEEGFVPNAALERALQQNEPTLRRFPASEKAFFSPRRNGRLVQPDLAATLRALAREGIRWFYHGPFAQKTEAWMKENGGVMNAADFAAYQVKRREPLRTTYREWEIIGFPPPSSGGVHVAQMLNILENFNVAAMKPESTDFAHLMAEVMKPAFADRAHWLGDPDFTPVPRGLLDKEYARQLATKIDLKQATPVTAAGEPPAASSDVFSKHTTHFSVTDSDGWWVACTATINTTFGSKVVVPDTGVVLNNEMDDFSAQPGVPNAFGLIGGEANSIAPGKRPLSSMSPTLVLKDGKPVASLGAAGGPTIITQTLLNLVRLLDFKASPAAALKSPRLHHQWRPDRLRIESTWPKDVLAELTQRGHEPLEVSAIGVSQMIAVDEQGRFTSAADPRAYGQAAGW